MVESGHAPAGDSTPGHAARALPNKAESRGLQRICAYRLGPETLWVPTFPSRLGPRPQARSGHCPFAWLKGVSLTSAGRTGAQGDPP